MTRNPQGLMRKQVLHQIVLGGELSSRIEAATKALSREDVQRMLESISPKAGWTIAMATRFLHRISLRRSSSYKGFISQYSGVEERIAMLLKFGHLIKWPSIQNLSHCVTNTIQGTEHTTDVSKSHDIDAWCFGPLLPGPSSRWILMGALLAVNDEVKGYPELLTLDAKVENTGFQFHVSTYWYSGGIVGKVLAALSGVQEIAGWITACPPAFAGSKIKRVHVFCHEVQHRFSSLDVRNMIIRTAPLGSLTPDNILRTCRIGDYHMPESKAEPHGDIDFQELILTNRSDEEGHLCLQDFGFEDPYLHLAAVSFTIGSETVELGLKYNVSFISAYTCSNGPHPIHGPSYPYRIIDIHYLHNIEEWGHADANEHYSISADQKKGKPNKSAIQTPPERVLVIECCTADAHVLARAWCANLGLNAIVARSSTTCLACAIRAAYAAQVSVVIMAGYVDEVQSQEFDGTGTEPEQNTPTPEQPFPDREW